MATTKEKIELLKSTVGFFYEFVPEIQASLYQARARGGVAVWTRGFLDGLAEELTVFLLGVTPETIQKLIIPRLQEIKNNGAAKKFVVSYGSFYPEGFLVYFRDREKRYDSREGFGRLYRDTLRYGEFGGTVAATREPGREVQFR
jgi:hypothetical protein